MDGRCSRGDSEVLHGSGRFRGEEDGVGGGEGWHVRIRWRGSIQRQGVSEAAAQTHDAGSLARVPAGMGPKPCLSRSEVELRVTDNYLDPHTNCIPFEDLGMGRMGKMERRLLLTAWNRRDRERLCDMEMEYSRRLMMETQLWGLFEFDLFRFVSNAV